MEKRFVYADNSATTPVYPEVLEAMMPAFGEVYGNPSSLYSKGNEAKAILNASREKIRTKPSKTQATILRKPQSI